MRCKKLPGLLALLFIFAGFILISSHTRTPVPAALHTRPTHSFISAQPLTFPHVAENVPGMGKVSPATQSRSAFMPNHLSIHRLIEVGSSNAVLPISPSAQLSANTLLLPATARPLGLSFLMLRE